MSAAVTDKFDISVSNADQVMAGCDGCPLTVDICGQGKACDAVSGEYVMTSATLLVFHLLVCFDTAVF